MTNNEYIPVSTPRDDTDILQVLRSGKNPEDERAAWNELVDKYQLAMEKRAITLFHGDDFWAGDIVQETWIKAHRNLHQCNGNLKGWLFTILRNNFKDALRKKRLESTHFMLSLGSDSHVNEDADTSEWLAGFIRKKKAFEAEKDYLSGIEPSAEQAYMDLNLESDLHDRIRALLPENEAEFLISYQESSGIKSGKDKVKYHRLKKKIISQFNHLLKDPDGDWVDENKPCPV